MAVPVNLLKPEQRFWYAKLVLAAIFVWQVFPDCFLVEKGGLTRFKIISEYVISGLLAGVGTQDAAGVLDETPLERDRPGEEQGIECGAIEAFAADDRARVLVVTGEGNLSFFAGAAHKKKTTQFKK